MKKVAEIEADALAKSGLKREEAVQLSHLTSSYLAKRSAAASTERLLAEAQRHLDALQAHPPRRGAAYDPLPAAQARVKSLTDSLAEQQKPREELIAKYGGDVVDALDKHEKELREIQEQMLNAALGGMNKQ